MGTRSRAKGQAPPPQDSESDSDGDGIVYLEAAPSHLQKAPTNEDAPIFVESSDEEDSDAGPSSKRRRSPHADDPFPPNKVAKRRGSGRKNAAAGPSSRPVAIVIEDSDESDSEAPPGNAEIILPKADYLVPIVLEIIPDADHDWVKENLERIMEAVKHTSSAPGQEAVDQVVNLALEDGAYPKAGGEPPPPPPEEPDYADPNYNRALRNGPGYAAYSLEMLETVFPGIPVKHIRVTFYEAGRLLVPAYKLLHRQSIAAEKPYTELKKKRGGKGKHRAEEIDEEETAEDPAADVSGRGEAKREKVFLRKIMAKEMEKEQEDMAAAAEKQKAEADHEERKRLAEAGGVGVECGCCFDTEAAVDTAACPEGHLFCHSCIRAHAESKLGDQIVTILCMDTSGCQEPFDDKALALVLSTKTMSLYNRLKQMRELELADIDGLESCPFCPFAMVIENENEKLFRCLNHECSKVSCRNCHRLEHIPKRCEEMDEDLKLDKRHAVEEAMSEALLRRCPKCAKPYIKDSGCNKIYCSGCRSLSCFICQKAITGYDHFNQQPGLDDKGRCPLWDRQEPETEAARIRQARDVAAQRLIDDAAQQGVVLAQEDIHVDAPVAPPRPPRVPYVGPAPPMVRHVAGLNLGDIRQQQRRIVQNLARNAEAAGNAGNDDIRQRLLRQMEELEGLLQRRPVPPAAPQAAGPAPALGPPPPGLQERVAERVAQWREFNDLMRLLPRPPDPANVNPPRLGRRVVRFAGLAPPALGLPGAAAIAAGAGAPAVALPAPAGDPIADVLNGPRALPVPAPPPLVVPRAQRARRGEPLPPLDPVRPIPDLAAPPPLAVPRAPRARRGEPLPPLEPQEPRRRGVDLRDALRLTDEPDEPDDFLDRLRRAADPLPLPVPAPIGRRHHHA